MAWLKKEPRGDRRADVRSAVQTAYIRQCFTDSTESPETFLPRFRDAFVFEDPEVEELVTDFMRPL